VPPALAIAGGVLLVAVFTAVLFAAVNSGLRRSIARRRAALEGEGVVRDSGVCRVSARYRRFRGRGLYMGAGIRIGSGQLILTRAHLHVLGVRGAEPVPLAELHRYRASVADGRLVITTDEPVGATGRLELRIKLDDAPSWVDALDDAGSRAAS
jgi:hypothetical protein